MKFGVSLAGAARATGPLDPCLDIAQAADALGYDSVWTNDRVGMLARFVAETGGMSPAYDPLMLVSALAATTTHVQVGTCVLVLPLRHPAMTAKMLAAADLLSNGRIVLGVGTGPLQVEYEALGLPAGHFERRGAVSDEYIRAIKEIWLATGPSSFSGDFVSFSDVGAFPKPRQRPHPPIVIAGNSRRSMTRASRHGNGYFATSRTPGELADTVAQLREICRKDRRDPREVEVYLVARVSIGGSAATDDRTPLSGSSEQIWEDLRAFSRAGLEHLVMLPSVSGEPDSPASLLRAVELFASEILPAFGSPRAAVRG